MKYYFKFIFLFFYLFNFSYALNCCSSYGFESNYQNNGGDYIRFPATDYSSVDDILNSLDFRESSQACNGQGKLVHSLGGPYNFSGVSKYQGYQEIKNCSCPIGKEVIDGECVFTCEDNETRVNGECVYTPPKLPFNCTDKGDYWSNSDGSDLSECQHILENAESVTSISFETGDNILDTCCVYQPIDNNDSGNGGSDNNDSGNGGSDNNDSGNGGSDNNDSGNGGSDNNDSGNGDNGDNGGIVPLTPICSKGREWNTQLQGCYICKSGELYDSVSRTCVDTCPVGTIWSDSFEECISDGSGAECPMGYTRSSETTESACTAKGNSLVSSFNNVSALFLDNDKLCCLKYSNPTDNSEGGAGSSSDTNTSTNNPSSGINGTNNRLDQLGNRVNDASNTAHTDSQTNTNAINDASLRNQTGLNNIGNALRDINNSFNYNPTTDDDDGDGETNSKLEKALSDAKKILDDGLASFNETKSSFESLASASDAPTMVIPGGDCEISFSIIGQNITISLATFAVFKPYIQVVLNLVLLVLTLRLYTTIARDIAQYFS